MQKKVCPRGSGYSMAIRLKVCTWEFYLQHGHPAEGGGALCVGDQQGWGQGQQEPGRGGRGKQQAGHVLP